MKSHAVHMAFVACLAVGAAGPVWGADRPQYEFESICVPAASEGEPKLEQFSWDRGLAHLDEGAVAWSGARKCVSCHTNGSYLFIRPALTARAGEPAAAVREFFVSELGEWAATPHEELDEGTRPAQIIYIAAGLAEWDANVSHTLSPETRQALALMFELQRDGGTWGSIDCWPPFESDSYHLATVAAMASATAPEWLATLKDEAVLFKVERLRRFLRTQAPPHDYGRILLLWTATRWPGLLPDAQRQELVDLVWKHQRADGGWSIRTFAAPEAWGRGNRAARLRAEPDLANVPSDGHQTGLALIVLRAAGIPADDARIQRGVSWLLSNQRQSGRWWTRSLNTDRWNFITYSSTAYGLLALAMCDAVPAETVAMPDE